LIIIGVGLLLRSLLRVLKCRKSLVSRIAATLEGTLLLLFCGLPFDTFEGITGVLDSNPAIFVLGGVAMVASSVWIIMNNTPVIIWILSRLFGNIPGLRAVLKTAIAYPISATFRTGLTISMFALIILTMMIIAVLNNTFSVGRIDPDRITGGFDIVATVPMEYQINDFRGRINSSDILVSKNFKSVVGSIEVPSLGRQLGSANKIFKPLAIRAMDTLYFETSKIQFSHYDPLYGTTTQEIWKSLASDPSLSVVSSMALITDDPFSTERSGFVVEGFRNSAGSDAWETITIQIRPAWGGEQILERKIVAVIDQAAESLNTFNNMTYLVTGESIRVPLLGSNIPYDTYQIELANDIQESPQEIVSLLETEFLSNGLDADSTEQLIKNSQSSEQAFNRLFQGFMGLGLVVGVAAIGVLSVRAVVERRQSIGMLRAIGYRSAMVQNQFLAEALFVTLMGVVLGLVLGTLTSWNIYQEVSKEVDGLVFSIPWGTILIIASITSIFALLSAYMPARQASKIYPAEALRYQR
jgi:putative ABC transport system permease protein